MVNGRELPDLRRVFDRLDLFEAIVVENGAVLYRPADDAEQALSPGPAPEFIRALKDRHVHPLSVGRVVVATWTINKGRVRDAIGALGLDWRIILNKDSLMCLPPGVDKASGLAAALRALGVPPERVLAVGDAENDVAFFKACGVAAAVGNALPEVKAAADIVMEAENGAGVVELIDRVLGAKTAAVDT
jgi:HAD superfamily hydrolase (TIGR01484 family)